MQFAELGANLFMKARKFNRDPKLFFSGHPSGVSMHVIPIAGLSLQPVLLDIEVEEMAEALSFFLRVPMTVVMPEAGMRVTLLRNADGSRRYVDSKQDVIAADYPLLPQVHPIAERVGRRTDELAARGLNTATLIRLATAVRGLPSAAPP
ncbi:hypothetical protein [Luteibacter rhizovicinus]|nr:hypothetical protein [Luteibacter rhizovicinus]KLD77239.1 hypothetical protein Y886_16930 [Xanthomonas hyacinthi DSM 19077]